MPRPLSALRNLSLVSGVYDLALGIGLLTAAPTLASLFGSTPVTPAVFGDVTGILLVAVGLGYARPWADPMAHRWYLWIMGPLLKGAGALAFLLNVWLRGAPPAFLLFVATDGVLALVTFAALRATARQASTV